MQREESHLLHVAAIVITYNRKALILKCLDAILQQSHPVTAIVLVDNASTDSTADDVSGAGYMSRTRPQYVRLEENVGGAGGYSAGMKFAYEKEYDWLRMMDEEAYITRAALIHAVSPAEQDALRRLFRCVKVLCIPNAIDPPQLPDTDVETSVVLPKQPLFLGRLAVDHKGLDRLLKGYARFLAQTGDQETRLILAGPDFRHGKKVLSRLAGTLQIAGRISLLGPVFGQAKSALLHSTYAFLHPSRWEGMPFAVLKALAVGCPVLITPETNLADIVAAYDAGVVVAGNSVDIARGLELLISMTQDRYLVMRQKARQLIDDHYTWARVTERIAQAYQKIVEGLVHA
jgi:glycosyltransferase involved in cell wall biosynthesis